MSEKLFDPIVTEVRRNRENLLADFNGDIFLLDAHIEIKRNEREASGAHYVTEEERLIRLAWNRQRRETEERRIALLIVENTTVAG